MRIAFVSHSRRKVGGTEAYLDSVLPAFSRAGHSVAWAYENNPSTKQDLISCPENVTSWCVAELGLTKTLEKHRQWKPDIIFTHGLADPAFEAGVITIAPSVLYVHNYYGTCISGDKLHSTTNPHVCDRPLGAACLLHYFPDRCGGRNPLTMWSEYRLQSRRLELMRRYRGLITNSQYLVRELARYELKGECVHPFVAGTPASHFAQSAFDGDPLRLIFAGRMSSLKGGKYLLEAAPIAQRALGRKLHVTFAGDGPVRNEWQRAASRLQSDRTSFDFPGWLSKSNLQLAIARSHLHVLPSIWPEPFGLSGLEAGLLGVPTVAFAVGGIPEWLHEGVNGHLAPNQPSAEALAAAIAKALSNAEHFEQLRAGACREAQRYRIEDHLAQLLSAFARVAA